MRFLPALAALFGSIVPCAASPITSYYNANIVYCVGSFDVGPCESPARSSGSPISDSRTVITSESQSLTTLRAWLGPGHWVAGSR